MPTNPDPEVPDDVAPPDNVIAAIARVQAEIGGIEKKKGNNEEGGGIKYKFRGIDAVAAAAQPLFGKHGVVIVPTTIERYVLDDIVVGSKPWTAATVEVVWTLYGPGGVNDRIEARTVGMGYDNSDKAYPKAFTQAYKNLLLRVLTVGDPADDNDGHTPERDNTPPPPEYSERSLAAYAKLPGLSEEAKGRAKELAAEYGKKLNAADMDADGAWLLTIEAIILDDAREAPVVEADEEPESEEEQFVDVETQQQLGVGS